MRNYFSKNYLRWAIIAILRGPYVQRSPYCVDVINVRGLRRYIAIDSLYSIIASTLCHSVVNFTVNILANSLLSLFLNSVVSVLIIFSFCSMKFN